MTSIPLDIGGFRGLALIKGYAADVDLTAFREIEGDAGEVTWSGKAAILNPPSFNLLEFTGRIDMAVGRRTATAVVVDATPGSGFIYIDGVGQPPFDTSVLGDRPAGVAVRFRAPYGVSELAPWRDDEVVSEATELTA